MHRLAFGFALVTLTATSCGLDNQKKPAPEKVGANSQEILGGSVDTTNDATVFVYGGNAACSGTLIHVNGSFGYVLTAGHCTNMTDIVYIPAGHSSYNDPAAQQFTVDQDTPDPQWTGSPQNGHDFRILRFSGANASLTVVPAASNPDGLSPGTIVDISGFGLTQSPPNGQTQNRMHIHMPIDQLDSMFLYFNQAVNGGEGACEGDSGGPAYATVNGQKMVVGATSFGDQSCTMSGASGRVELDYNSFIAPTIGGSVMETCDSCFNSATATGGACYATVQTCENDMATGGCSSLVQCLNNCAQNDQTCVNKCAAAASSTGVNEYNAIFDCSYCNTCKTLCPQTGCGGTSSTGGSTGAIMTTSAASGNTGAGTGVSGATSGATGAGGSGATSGATSGHGVGGSGSSDGPRTITTCACSTVGSDGSNNALGFAGLAAALGVVFARRKRAS